MSHITTVKVKIKNLKALKESCKALGLEFRENQKTYHWYGYSVGDYPLPEGFSKEDLGKCEHAIGIPGNKEAYEIGVCKSRNQDDEYTLLWDFWHGGYGLEEVVGKDCNRLTNSYAEQVALEEAKAIAESQGFFLDDTFDEESQERVLTLVRY